MDESDSTTQGGTDRKESLVTINDLPTEMLWEVFSYLDLKDLGSVCSVSRRWKDVGNGVFLMAKHEYTITSYEDTSKVARTFRSVPNLRKIKIEHSANRNIVSVIKLLLELCTDVRNLYIDNGIRVESNLLRDIVKKFPHLDSLSTHLCFNNMNVMKEIGSCLELRTLVSSESSCNICTICSSIDLKPIAEGCPSLVHLDIRHCRYNPNDFIYLLKQKKHLLQSLQFTGENVYPGTVPPFNECTNLNHIACDYFSSDTLRLGVFLDEISSLSGLKRLGLGQCEAISKDDLKKLSKCSFSSTLSELDLKCSVNMQDLPRTIVSYFPNIRKICIEDLGNSGKSVLRELLKLKKLQHVKIVRWSVSRRWFRKLLKCKNINSVVLQNCYLLSEDDCLKLVTNMKLKYLKITECCALTNRFLKLFPYCKNLKELHVSVKYPSKHYVKKIKARQPSTRIDVRNFKNCP